MVAPAAGSRISEEWLKTFPLSSRFRRARETFSGDETGVGTRFAPENPDFGRLLLDKLSDALDQKQKARKIGNLLQKLRKQGKISIDGTTQSSTWKLKHPESWSIVVNRSQSQSIRNPFILKHLQNSSRKFNPIRLPKRAQSRTIVVNPQCVHFQRFAKIPLKYHRIRLPESYSVVLDPTPSNR